MHQKRRKATLGTYFKNQQKIEHYLHSKIDEFNDEASGFRQVATFKSNVSMSICFISEKLQQKVSLENRIVVCSLQNEKFIPSGFKLICDDPRTEFFDIVSKLEPDWEKTACTFSEAVSVLPGAYSKHPTAFVDKDAVIGENAVIKAFAYVGPGCIVGRDTIIGEHTVVGADGPSIFSGADGVQRSWRNRHWGKIFIGNNVEIGSNCTILRGILDETIVDDDSIIGNNVHIGHGCVIDTKVWLSAGVIICGHAELGSHVTIGAGSTIRDKIKIAEGAKIAQGSNVVKNISKGVAVRGVAASEYQFSGNVAPNRL